MKTLSPAFAAHLASGATTLCRCWLLRRRDGTSLGLTDHDCALTVADVLYHASSGMRSSAVERNSNLAQDGMEVTLSADQIASTDLEAGRYDGAQLELWLVNWQDPAQRVRLMQGEFGRVRREQGSFQVELQGASADMHRTPTRVYRRSCEAVLGDKQCRVDLSAPPYREAVEVVEVRSAHHLITSLGASEKESGWFSGGAFLLDLPGAEQRYEIISDRSHVQGNTQYRSLHLREPLADEVTEEITSSRVALVVGCDKQLTTCTRKFSNAKNFRGHPHMPSESVLVSM